VIAAAPGRCALDLEIAAIRSPFMSIRFDDKGKFYTEVISKETVEVIIQTATHRILGNIHIRPGERLKDEINQAEPFFAVTEASICDHSGKEVYRTDFLVIYRDHIIWMLPTDQLAAEPAQSDGGEA
jgi:hypothetical protein